MLVQNTGTTTRESSLCSSRTVWNSVIAGYVAGVTGTLIGHPMDSAKVWLQTGTHRGGLTSTTTSTSSIQQSASSSSATTTTPSIRSSGPTATTTAISSSSSSTSHPQASRGTTAGASNTSAKQASTTPVTPAPAAARRSSTLALQTTRIMPNNLNHYNYSTNTTATTPTGLLRQHQQQLLLRGASVFRNTASKIRALYAGVSGPLVTVGIVQSINFAIYDSVRRILHQHTNNDHHHHHPYVDTADPLLHVAVASMTAGAALACITNPLLLVKTKQQTTTATTSLSYRQAVLQTINWNAHRCRLTAVRNLYTGFVPHAISEIVGRGVYFGTYEALKRHLAAQQHHHDHPNGSRTATLTDRMVAAGLAGVVCWSVIFPLDAVRCRMYAATSAVSSIDMARHMYATAGWQSFYRGFGVTLLRAGPVAAFVLPIYDITAERLSRMQ
jgi:solute carrier family 25 (mitochondrial carnitine/acylcarnitine transporter), member 20/29